ncbi:uncharacterized protein LOC107632689 [Arachis ipaensis]|uniref:uncharacterized protein LOC107632689 n=1 Tax=Arachis ipaensis TaxID=130454 RepID=UPI000A2B2137|nr:uncharacterized protein LOC107632689 [Arachis ipaensis]
MRGKPIITMLEEVRGYVMRILARNKKALVGYHGRITPVQQSRLERKKKESNYWRPFPSGDEDGNVYEVQRLPVKVSVDLGRRTCSCSLWLLTGLPCRHACAAIAYQNCRAEDFAHNWLTMRAYNLAYQWTVQPVPSQEYWEKVNHYPLLPPVYRKPIGRPTKKRDSRRDGPRENPDPHRAKRRYDPIKCKYCLKTGHNSRGCDKKKEAMASGRAAAGSGSQHQGAATITEGMAVDDLDEDAAREQEMYWKETLEVADAEASASDSPNVNVDDLNCVNPSEEPMAIRPPPSNSSTAYIPPRPIMNPTMSNRPIRRRNVKRPPPSQPSPLRPPPP